MNLNQLDCFVAAAENRTFFDAAELLHISQSALSKQIMNLERELDVQLFDRSKRRAVLSDAGRTFYPDAKQILESCRLAKTHLTPFLESEKELSIGTLPFLSQYRLTGLLKDFTKMHPNIRLFIDEVEDEALLYGLKTGKYDAVFIRKELLHGNLYKSYPLAADHLVALLPLHHPLSGKRELDLSALSDEPFILMPKHTNIYALSIRACRHCGFTPHVLRTARAESLLSAVAAGEGAGLLFEKTLNVFHAGQVAAIPLSSPVESSVVLTRLSRKKVPKNLGLFLNYIKSTPFSYNN